LSNLNFNITDLYRLQLAENRIKFYEKEIDMLKNDEELKSITEELQNAQSEQVEFLKTRHELEVQRKKLEDEMSLKNEKIKKDEQKLSSGTITSSKEIVSLNEEITSLRNLNSEIENNILEIMIKTDDLNDELKTQNEKKEKIEAQVKKLSAEIEVKTDEKKMILNKYLSKKQETISKIPTAQIDKFTEVAKKRDGVAVGVLKERLCLACNMEMSMLEAMEMKNDDLLYRCPNCKRMLFRYRPEIDQINEEYKD
jgi:predicted  nucleic acid-binding Zn-ribbon protein